MQVSSVVLAQADSGIRENAVRKMGWRIATNNRFERFDAVT
jgi:hypothetical protein